MTTTLLTPITTEPTLKGTPPSNKPNSWGGSITACATNNGCAVANPSVWRIALGVFLSGQVMLLSLGINLEPDTPSAIKQSVQLVILGITLVAILLLGKPLFVEQLGAWRRCQMTVESFFLLTLVGSLIASVQAMLTGVGAVYFEIPPILLTVYTLGKVLGVRAKNRSLTYSQEFLDIPSRCWKMANDGTTAEASIESIQVGDRIQVFPGELIPVDGVIQTGASLISSASMKGEAFATPHGVGDEVLAGSINHDAMLLIRSTATGTNREIDQVLQLLQRVSAEPTRIETFTNQIARILVPFLVLVACATFAYWTLSQGWTVGLYHAMSVLLVACPCALGLATPIAIWSMLARLASRGVVIHNSDTIEKLARANWIGFDKTGTLSQIDPVIREFHVIGSIPEQQIRAWLALIQEKSQHPFAKPFANKETLSNAQILNYQNVPGYGIDCTLEDEGELHHIRVGKVSWVDPEKLFQNWLILDDSGQHIGIGINDKPTAIITLKESLDFNAESVIRDCQLLGIEVGILTGDSAERAEQWNLPNTQAELLPRHKETEITARQEQGKTTIFVGDGINDAPALARADVGIAVLTGSPLACHHADITIPPQSLETIPWMIELARETDSVLKRSLLVALLYNGIGVALAAIGLIHPVVAVLLMTSSSLFVTWYATAITRKDRSTHKQLVPVEVSFSAFLKGFGQLLPSAIHAVSFALQGPILAKILGLSTEWVLLLTLVFAGCGIFLAWVWNRTSQLDHVWDMSIGMLTLGNLGMTFGWWFDLKFGAIQCQNCCNCLSFLKGDFSHAGMWIGMLLTCNLAMLFLGKRTHDCKHTHHPISMYLFGNVGMLLGMIGGAYALGLVQTSSSAINGLLHWVGMTAGMIFGMIGVSQVCDGLFFRKGTGSVE